VKTEFLFPHLGLPKEYSMTSFESFDFDTDEFRAFCAGKDVPGANDREKAEKLKRVFFRKHGVYDIDS
jgi:hypothetical protein